MVILSKNKIVKSISFNITNEEDQKCLDQIKEINFSSYVKELILADIQKENIRVIRKPDTGGIKIVIL